MVKTTLLCLESHKKTVEDHLSSSPDREVCGLIGGIWQPFDRRAIVKSVIPIPNIDPYPAVRYTMSPKAQIAAMLEFEKQGWELIGIYHSHPNGTAAPSPTDIAESYYPAVVYLIGVPGSDLRAWRIVRGQVYPVEIVILD